MWCIVVTNVIINVIIFVIIYAVVAADDTTATAVTNSDPSMDIQYYFPNFHIFSPINHAVYHIAPELSVGDVLLDFRIYDEIVANDPTLQVCMIQTGAMTCFERVEKKEPPSLYLCIGQYELDFVLTQKNDETRAVLQYTQKSVQFTVAIAKLDLDRILLIKNAKLEDLSNRQFIELSLMPALGFNPENTKEQPLFMRENSGGLMIWQYPNQLAPYLLFLKSLQPTSYLEIGCRWGGTFILTVEYLRRFGELDRAVAVDLIASPVQKYSGGEFYQMNSSTSEFKEWMRQNAMDVIFIDGDHTYEGVKSDFETVSAYGEVFVFHDILNYSCIGVAEFWNELKLHYREEFEFFEFTDQYPEVIRGMKQLYLGIGVAVRKSRITIPRSCLFK